mgnify:CR=1 FL=1
MEMASTMQKSPGGGKGTAASRGSNPVQSLDRGLALLEAMAEAVEGATLTELAQATGLAPSTAHRLLASLRDRGFAVQDAEGGVWRVGARAFGVGNAFLRGRNYVALARRTMRDLVEAGGETVNLAVEEAGEAVYLAQAESSQMMRAFARPGARVPLHCSGVGKALLAALPVEEAERIVAVRGLPRLTERTVIDRAALIAELARIRARGYAVDDGEHAVGLRCVAATIHDESGRPLAALSVSGPAARIDDARLEVLGRMVAEACVGLTVEVGGRSPD